MANTSNWTSFDWTRFGDKVTEMSRELHEQGLPADAVAKIVSKYVDAVTGGESEKEEDAEDVFFDIPDATNYEGTNDAAAGAAALITLGFLGITALIAAFSKS